MCGIFCYICKNDDKIQNNKEFELCREAILNRGPDSFQNIRVPLTQEWYAMFACSVLWTQGSERTVQPVINEDILLWNGDLYTGLETQMKERSDTELLFSSLGEDCQNVLMNVCGPYAFIFWNSGEKKLYFGRDIIGRHSLLWDVSSTEILLTSTGNSSLIKLEEVPSCGIYAIDLSKPEISLDLYPWSQLNEISTYFSEESPGVTLKSIICHKVLEKENGLFWLGNEPSEIDLDHFRGISSNQQGIQMLECLYKKISSSERIEQLKSLLFKSVEYRVETKPEYCNKCIHQQIPCDHPKIGVLFSGGLDSSILALIADKFVPKGEAIDLYNVAFERISGNGFKVPDRNTGLQSLEELSRLSPDRKWNFIEINIAQAELIELRKDRIHNLIHPLKSILDDSLGCALWFAARGQGLLNGEEYNSTARVVLLGMGADEIFGGYSRHRKIFAKGGWVALGEELNRELRAIGRRNLGRDNRVVADHGRQPRAPFLDESFLNFVHQLPPWQRCCLTPEFPSGCGDKLLLRLLAWDLGFRNVACFPKRALQFGSRIANPKEKGHQISFRLS